MNARVVNQNPADFDKISNDSDGSEAGESEVEVEEERPQAGRSTFGNARRTRRGSPGTLILRRTRTIRSWFGSSDKAPHLDHRRNAVIALRLILAPLALLLQPNPDPPRSPAHSSTKINESRLCLYKPTGPAVPSQSRINSSQPCPSQDKKKGPTFRLKALSTSVSSEVTSCCGRSDCARARLHKSLTSYPTCTLRNYECRPDTLSSTGTMSDYPRRLKPLILRHLARLCLSPTVILTCQHTGPVY